MRSPATAATWWAAHHTSPAAMSRRLVGYGISLLALLGIAVAAGDVLGSHYPDLMRLGVALCLGAQALVIAECLRPSRLMWTITAMAGLGVLAITGGLLSAPAPWPGLEWRTNIWVGPVLQFLVLLHLRRWGWPLVAVITLGCWAVVTVVHQLDWRIQVVDLAFTLTPIATLAIGDACITTLLTELRLSQFRRLHDEQQIRRAAMLEQERRERIRLAHDSLLHTVQQVSRGWAPPTPEEASALAAGATLDLQSSSDSFDDGSWVPLRPALEAALEGQGCSIAWRGGAVWVPASVCEAIVGAAREAIRNVVKHAGGNAVVSITRWGKGCRVTITDEGPGFNPLTPHPGHLGVAEGITERMSEVGGSATIGSDDHGSTVQLDWTTEPVDWAEPFGPVARTLISWLPIPVLAASLVHILVLDVGPSAVGVAMIWLATLAVTILGMIKLRTTGFSWWQPVVLTVLSMALLTANYMWISAEGTNGYDVWTPSLVGALMVLALPGRQLGRAVAMAVGVILVAGAASGFALGWETALNSQFGSIMAVVMYVLAPLALATGAAVLANHARHTEELHAAKRLGAELQIERDATRRQWIARMRHLAEPFLMDLAHGTADPSDPSVVRHARILEARLRDELSLWPNGTDVADRAHDLRLRGWDCTIDVTVAGEDDKRDLLALMTVPLSPLLGQRLHFTNRNGVPVATITDPPLTEEQWSELGPDIEAVYDEDFTQLRPPAITGQHPSRVKETR